jgi:hypothetical protein
MLDSRWTKDLIQFGLSVMSGQALPGLCDGSWSRMQEMLIGRVDMAMIALRPGRAARYVLM